MKMEVTAGGIIIAITIVILTSIAIKLGLDFVNWVWLRPKKLEKLLRAQGLEGNPYRLLYGEIKEFSKVTAETKSKAISPVFDDVLAHVLPYHHQIINKYGKSSFIWFGPNPRLSITDPELIKEILNKPTIFQKPHPRPLLDIVIGGLLVAEDEKWTKHRKLINPAFHLEKLKNMLPAFHASCSDMINKWEMLIPAGESSEVDVWPYLVNLSGDVISRSAFGNSHEEGTKIFQLQKEQIEIVFHLFQLVYIPGWRFLPFKIVKRFNRVCDEIQATLRAIVSKREKAIEMGEANNNDLLGILLESNSREMKDHGSGMSMDDVIEECKLFYFAGSETTSNLLVWTMVLLSIHPSWQIKARDEVLQVFGTREPDLDGLNHLKIVTMILNEVLRLYPPAPIMIRTPSKETKLGNLNLPAGVELSLPIIQIHHDHEIWGEDATEFKPERFSQGVSSATKGKASYFPFSGGPRICIGQNFAMIEAKMALTMILQRFSFELSPAYKHSPSLVFTLSPYFGAPLILHKI